MTNVTVWLGVALLSLGPVSFMIVEDTGGLVWALTALAGLIVTGVYCRRWWPELQNNGRPVLTSLGLLLVYLAIPVFGYCVIDGSDFAESRLGRQLLFLGVPFILLLLWWLRPAFSTVLAILALNALGFGIYATWDFLSSSDRADGVTHAIHFGNTGLFLGFASLALFPVTRHYGWRLLAVAGMVAGVCASILAGARGGWVAVPLLIVITLIMLFREFRLNRNLLLGLIAVIMLTLAGLAQTGMVQGRINSAKQELIQLSANHRETSIGYRITMWEQAWLQIQEAPIVGTGFSGYRDRILAAVESGELSPGMRAFSTEPHNEYLYQWLTRGIIGLLFFIFCLAAAGWYFFRWLVYGDSSQRAIAHVGLTLVVIIAIGGLTITVIDQRAVIRFITWILALLLYCVWMFGSNSPIGRYRVER